MEVVLDVKRDILRAKALNEKRKDNRIELDICPILFIPKDGMARERYIIKPNERVIGITGWTFISNDSQKVEIVSDNNKGIHILDDIIYPIYKNEVEISIVNRTNKVIELSSGYKLAKAILDSAVTRINILK